MFSKGGASMARERSANWLALKRVSNRPTGSLPALSRFEYDSNRATPSLMIVRVSGGPITSELRYSIRIKDTFSSPPAQPQMHSRTIAAAAPAPLRRDNLIDIGFPCVSIQKFQRPPVVHRKQGGITGCFHQVVRRWVGRLFTAWIVGTAGVL